MDQVTNFSVKVRLLQSSYAHLLEEDSAMISPFSPGMSAKVDILTREMKQVLSIPIQSVTTRESDEEGGESELGVFVMEEGYAIWKPVETDIQDNRYIAVTMGLDSSAQVITGPYEKVSRTLENGDAIEVDPVADDDIKRK